MLSRPQWPSIQDAVSALQHWRFTTAHEAVRYLQTALLKQDLRLQFMHLFPELARECYLNPEAFPQPEKRFFELIEQNLFPLATDALMDTLEAEGEAMPWFIPVYSVNPWLDSLTYGEETQLSDVEQALIFVSTGFTASDCADGLTNLGWETELPGPVNWTCYTLSEDRFVELCTRLDEKLKDAYMAISVMTGDSDNFWIDNDVEMLDQIILEWSVANLESLAKEYQQAVTLIRITTEFLNYLKERPNLALQIVRFWMDAIIPRPLRESQPIAGPSLKGGH